MLPVLTVTMNPALDLATSVAELKPLQKLRCSTPRLDPGGGGVNVSRAIKELGGNSVAFVALGGSTGEQLSQLLRRAGLDLQVWPVSGETRTSFTVIEQFTGLPYRFVLPGPVISSAEAEAMLARLVTQIGQHPGYVVLSGGLPPGAPDDFYGRIVAQVRELGARCMVDTHGEPLRLAARARPHLIRLNHLEAQELVGGDADAAAHLLAMQLVERGLTETAIVTLGDRGAIVATPHGHFEIQPPRVTVKSGVGAGDSFVAALVFGLANNWPLEDAARYGVAAAAAAVTTEATELCKRATVDAFYKEIGGIHRGAA